MYDVFVNFIKAACGLSKKSKEQIVDIDAADVNYELAVLEYVEDIYSFYKLAEVFIVLNLSFIFVSSYHKFELNPETLYLTIYIVDRYLAVETASRRELQLVGISSMLIASKYEETWAPELNDFVCISDKTYSHEQVLTMEKQIHEQLEWYLTVPTPYVFLVRSIKASLPDSEFCDWSTYLQLLHPSGNDSGNLCTSMLHCVKLVVVDKVAVVGEVKLAMWNPHCLPISRLLLQADELIPMDSTVSGYATTSLFSKAVWVSINPLLSTGYQSPLKLDEVPLLPPDFQAVRTKDVIISFLAIVQLSDIYVGTTLIRSFIATASADRTKL
ncbi:Cyclin-B1-1 [Capsicum annuum]|uniref:Cyclin-B1-1 n=1 Tax=Capsicum annuum TaxID=4072 RepID=A0A2G2ZKK1_CAPAN|nr:Cyclin-B1-1 [Capsicum annuum]